MSGSSKDRVPVRAGQTAPAMQLFNWPLRDDGVRAWLLTLLLAAVAAVSAWKTDSARLGLVILVSLALAAWRLWIPVRFELGPRGVVQTLLRRQRRIPWSEFSGFQPRRRGILLVCDRESGPLACLRGVYIRCSNDTQRQQLLETINFYLGGPDG